MGIAIYGPDTGNRKPDAIQGAACSVPVGDGGTEDGLASFAEVFLKRVAARSAARSARVRAERGRAAVGLGYTHAHSYLRSQVLSLADSPAARACEACIRSQVSEHRSLLRACKGAGLVEQQKEQGESGAWKEALMLWKIDLLCSFQSQSGP